MARQYKREDIEGGGYGDERICSDCKVDEAGIRDTKAVDAFWINRDVPFALQVVMDFTLPPVHHSHDEENPGHVDFTLHRMSQHKESCRTDSERGIVKRNVKATSTFQNPVCVWFDASWNAQDLETSHSGIRHIHCIQRPIPAYE